MTQAARVILATLFSVMLSLIRAQWRSIVVGILFNGFPQGHSLSIRRKRALGFEERVQFGCPTARSYVTSPTIQQLVEEGKYQQAGVMLVEFQKLRTAVSPHPIYAKAVEHLLSQQTLGDKDREILCYWLQLLPDAQYANPLLLQGCVDVLRRHTKADPRFITATGGILARKGYQGLIQDDILPLAKEYLETDVFTFFEQDVSHALARYDYESSSSSSDGVKPSEVFEDASQDYISIMTTSAHSPSILKAVEASLPLILPAPDIDGQSVFEDEMNEDYLIHQSTHDRHRQSATDQLLHLVTIKKYQDAFNLLNELQQLHATIPFSDAYGYAALDVLHRPLSDNFTLDNQLELFTTWFSLMPTVKEPRTSHPNIIQIIRRELMNDPLTSIIMMERFLLILAEKGYQNFVGREEISLIMRFAPANETVFFIQQLENAYLSYCEKHSWESAVTTWKIFTSQLRSRAIRHLAYSGRVEEAVSLLPQGDSDFQITLYSCEKLLRTVRDAGNPLFVQFLPRIEAVYQQLSSTDEIHQLRQLHLKAENETMMNQLGASDPDVHIGKPLPETLRYLKRVLRSTEDPPHPTIIVEFLQRYLATGRTRAPNLLLNLSNKASFRNYSAFLFAEMIYYRLIGQHHLIIKTFIDHFYLSGVPRTNVLRIYNRLEHLRSHHPIPDPYPMADFVQSKPDTLTRICNYTGLGPTGLPISKAWPMKVHCNLVWHALVALTPTDHELEVLYMKLLSLARGHDPLESSNQSLQRLRPLLPPSSWRTRIDTAAFTPFMRRLMIHAGPSRGSRIIQDMVELNIEPSIYHYTELAGFYAQMGEVEIVMKILRTLEHESGLYERLERQKQNHSPDLARGLATVSSNPLPTDPVTPSLGSNPDSSKPRVYTAPEPDLVFYISLMRGFVLSKNTWGFERVHTVLRRMKQSLPNKKFYKDQEAILDDVYKDYRMMMMNRQTDYKANRRSKYVQFMQVRNIHTRIFQYRHSSHSRTQARAKGRKVLTCDQRSTLRAPRNLL